MTLGERIAFLRKEKNIFQEDLAKKIGISRSTLTKIENNKTSIDFITFGKICECLNVSFNYLYYGKDVIKKNIKIKEIKKKKEILFIHKFKFALMIQTLCILAMVIITTGFIFFLNLFKNLNSSVYVGRQGIIEIIFTLVLLYLPFILIYFIHTFSIERRTDVNED